MDSHFVKQNSATHDGSGAVRSPELPGERGGQRRRTKRDRERVTFMLPSDLKRRLRHYLADHPKEMSEVAEKALDEFLTQEGYPPASEES